MRSLLGIATVLFVADQLTKTWALDRLEPARPVVVVPDFFHLTLVMNPGVAFGMFAGVPPEWRWLVMGLSLVALVLLCSLAMRIVPGGGWLGTVAIGLVLGGAAGNLLDRWRLGAVVDFIDVFWKSYHWPAFNVADSAITVGVVLLGVQLAFAREQPAPSGGCNA
jgi:signal peptidase II